MLPVQMCQDIIEERELAEMDMANVMSMTNILNEKLLLLNEANVPV